MPRAVGRLPGLEDAVSTRRAAATAAAEERPSAAAPERRIDRRAHVEHAHGGAAERGGGSSPANASAAARSGAARARPRSAGQTAGDARTSVASSASSASSANAAAWSCTIRSSTARSCSAPSAYQTPKSRLRPPSAGAIRSNDAARRRVESVSPKPVESSAIETAVKRAKSASASDRDAAVVDRGEEEDADARASAHPVHQPDSVRLERRAGPTDGGALRWS